MLLVIKLKYIWKMLHTLGGTKTYFFVASNVAFTLNSLPTIKNTLLPVTIAPRFLHISLSPLKAIKFSFLCYFFKVLCQVLVIFYIFDIFSVIFVFIYFFFLLCKPVGGEQALRNVCEWAQLCVWLDSEGQATAVSFATFMTTFTNLYKKKKINKIK